MNDVDFTSLSTAYNNVKSSTGGITLITIAIALGVILLLKKFTVAYKRAHVEDSTGEKKYLSAKQFFDLFWQYIIVFIVIVCSPVFISMIETGMSSFEDQFVSKSSEIAEKKYSDLEESINKESDNDSSGIWDAVVKFFKFKAKTDNLMALSILSMLYTYLLYMFSSTHYIYLILLELVAPIAVVCALDKDTFPFFQTWVKNLIICYLMIPAFIIANLFSDQVLKIFDEQVIMLALHMTNIGIFVSLIFGVILKFRVFGFASNCIYKLL